MYRIVTKEGVLKLVQDWISQDLSNRLDVEPNQIRIDQFKIEESQALDQYDYEASIEDGKLAVKLHVSDIVFYVDDQEYFLDRLVLELSTTVIHLSFEQLADFNVEDIWSPSRITRVS